MHRPSSIKVLIEKEGKKLPRHSRVRMARSIFARVFDHYDSNDVWFFVVGGKFRILGARMWKNASPRPKNLMQCIQGSRFRQNNQRS